MVATAAGKIDWISPPQNHSVPDGLKAGKALRDRVPRSAHAGWQPPAGRPNTIDTLRASDAGRLPILLPIRYGRMLKSPFTFYRGAAAVMATDLGSAYVSGIRTQICGDCHLLNFGAFGTPERHFVFDVNDFDETISGAWEWDVKRLAASVVIAARHLDLKALDARAATLTCVRTYRERLREYALMPVLDVWYARLDQLQMLEMIRSARVRRSYEISIRKAKSQTSAHVFPRLTQAINGRRRIVDDAPLMFHPPDEAAFMENAQQTFRNYRETLPEERRALLDRFTLLDAAYKVVGVGSVGTRCWIALLLAAENDPLILQVKEAGRSAFALCTEATPYDCQGERVVTGQRLMQAASDLFLGWSRSSDGIDFYVRQLRDLKTSPDVDHMTAAELTQYAQFCGWALARAHAKASGTAAMISGYLGRSPVFDEAIAAFAEGYADQNERDYEALVEAVRSGAIAADKTVR